MVLDSHGKAPRNLPVKGVGFTLEPGLGFQGFRVCGLGFQGLGF